VIFADGNNRNFDINNLVLVTNGELAVMNRFELCRKNPEATKTGLILAKMIMKTAKLKRG
jgi:hypothetical protein